LLILLILKEASMATTSMLATNPLTQAKWEKEAWLDMYKRTWFGLMIQRGTIFTSDALSSANINGAGDNITFSFTGILTQQGVGEGGSLVGNEEALDLNSDNMVINVLRAGVNSPNTNTIEQQRTSIVFENQARELLPKWHMSRLDASVFNQLAGVNSTTITVDTTVYSGANRLFVQGNNAITPPSANRILRAGGVADDESLTAPNTFTLDLVDAALELALTTQPTIEELDDNSYDLFISHEQAVDLKRDTTGKIQWYTNELAIIQGGDMGKDHLIIGSRLGSQKIARYSNVNIYECARVANGVDSGTNAALPNVRRAVLVGKKAGAFGSPFGGRPTDRDVPFKFFTELQDYDYLKGVEARMIYGMKKLQFGGEDLGSIVISTYAAPHS
jgi:hypothetical protein